MSVEESNSSFFPTPDQMFDVKLPPEMTNFVEQFNKDPQLTTTNLKIINENFADPYYLARILSTTQGLSPYKRSEILLNPSYQTQPILYFFFSSLNSEFTTIIDSAFVLFGLLALPNNLSLMKLIISSFTEAYLTKNPYCRLKKAEVTTVVSSYIGFCARSKSTKMISPDEFKTYYRKSSISEENIFHLFTESLAKPLTLKYVFGEYDSPPEVNKTGAVSNKGKFFKLTKNTYLKTVGFWLEIYSDSKYTNLKNKFMLYDVTASVSKSQDGYSLEISSNTNSKLIMGPGKLYEESKFAISSDSKDVLTEWADLINFISFVCSCHAIIDSGIQKADSNVEYMF